MIINTQKQLNSTSRKRNSILNTQKLINSALAVGGLALMAAGAQAQQGLFNFTTVFTPNPVTSSDLGSFITVLDGANQGVNAAGIGSQINLTNFSETSALIPPAVAAFSTPFNIALTINPVGDGFMTKNFTGTFSGQFNNQQTLTNVVFNAPGSQTFDFTSQGLGIYTVNNLSFVAPGPTGNTTLGSIGAQVSFTPSATTPVVPEPASIVPFALGGLALLGLAARKGRRTNGAAV